MQAKSGFTLVELLVVVAVVSILATVVIASLSGTRERARDAQRQSDLRVLQAAVEEYKQQHGRYPRMGASSCIGTDGFSTQKQCSQYINPEIGIALPMDPNIGSGDGYAYYTNTEGTAYKIMAMNTVEGEIVNEAHEFASCSFENVQRPPNMGGTMVSLIMCEGVINNGNSRPNVCQISNSRFQHSYGVWGGFAGKTTTSGVWTAPGSVLDNTQQVWCR